MTKKAKTKVVSVQDLQSEWVTLNKEQIANRVLTGHETPEDMAEIRRRDELLRQQSEVLKTRLMEAVEAEMAAKIKAFKRAIKRGDPRPDPGTEDGQDLYAAWSSDEAFFDLVQDSPWELDEPVRDQYEAAAEEERNSIGLGVIEPPPISEAEYQSNLETAWDSRTVEAVAPVQDLKPVLDQILAALTDLAALVKMTNDYLGVKGDELPGFVDRRQNPPPTEIDYFKPRGE